jgi:hypothetical protein
MLYFHIINLNYGTISEIINETITDTLSREVVLVPINSNSAIGRIGLERQLWPLVFSSIGLPFDLTIPTQLFEGASPPPLCHLESISVSLLKGRDDPPEVPPTLATPRVSRRSHEPQRRIFECVLHDATGPHLFAKA